MRGMRLVILMCAAVSAMGAMWMMNSALKSQANLPAPQQQLAAIQPVEEEIEAPVTSQVLVASQEIPIGKVLGPEDFTWQAWPTDSVGDNFYTEGEDVDAIETLTGTAARLVIVEGEPITSNKIVELNGTGVLAALLRPGMRAISIPISVVTGAGGFILPGDFVDILLTRQIQIEELDEDSGIVLRSEALNQTDTIMQTVRVLAIDQQLNETEAAASIGSTATLELTPEQAKLITLTRQMAQQQRGFLTLSLRSFKEMIDEYGDDIDQVKPVTTLDLHALVEARLQAANNSKARFLNNAKNNKSNDDLPILPVNRGAKSAPAETVTLIRNGRPIVVHTITPQSAGAQ